MKAIHLKNQNDFFLKNQVYLEKASSNFFFKAAGKYWLDTK